MNIHLESLLDQLAPWDLTIQIGEVKHATRPLTLGQLAVIEKMESDPASVSLASIQALVMGLFVSPPDFAELPTDALRVIIQAVVEHWSERQKKKGPAGAKTPKTQKAAGKEDRPATAGPASSS